MSKAVALLVLAAVLVGLFWFVAMPPQPRPESPPAAVPDKAPDQAPDLAPAPQVSKPAESQSAGSPQRVGQYPGVRGRVIDGDGNGLQGASIIASFTGDAPNLETRSGEDGTFRFDSLPEAKVRLAARMNGYYFEYESARNIAAGSEVDLVLRPAAVLSGRVIDEEGVAVPSALVQAKTLIGDGDWQWEAKVESDHLGRFELARTRPGRVDVIAEAAGYTAETVTIDVEAGPLSELEIVIGRGLSVSGIVKDSSGEPLIGIIVSGVGTGQDGRTMTRSDGTFQLWGFAPGGVFLSVFSTGYLDSSVEAKAGDQDLIIVLTRTAAVELKVLDPSGKGIANAWVNDEKHRTNEHGSLVMDDLHPGPCELVAHLDGFLESEPHSIELLPGMRATGIVLQLRPAAWILGVVIDENGDPLPRAKIEYQEELAKALGDDGHQTADDAGEFRVGPLKMDARYRMFAVPPDVDSYSFSMSDERVQSVLSGSEGVRLVVLSELRKESEETAFVEGTVFDADGNPLVKSAVDGWGGSADILFRYSNQQTQRSSSGTKVESDASGRFRMELEPGDYAFAARPRNDALAPSKERSIRVAPGERVTGFDLHLQPAGVVTVRVVDPSGVPLPGATVEIKPLASSIFDSYHRGRFTDEGGTATFKGIPDGPHWSEIELEGYRDSDPAFPDRSPPELLVSPGETLEATMWPSGRIRGRVIGADGAPIHSLVIQVALRVPHISNEQVLDQGPFHMSTPIATDEGVFDIASPDQQPAALLFQASGGLIARIAVSGWKPGGVTDLGTIELAPVSKICGRVVDAGGTPVAGAQVQLLVHETGDPASQTHDNWEGSPRETEAATDGAGQFCIEGVAVGVYVLSASTPDWHAMSELVRMEGDAIDDVEIVLGAGGAISGSARRADGEPLAEKLITVKSGGPSLRDERVRRSRTGATGEFRFDGLEAGEHIVTLWLGTGEGMARTVTVGAPGSEVLCDFVVAAGCSLQGSVRVAGESLPRPQQLWLHSLSTPGDLRVSLAAAVNEQDGSFRFEPTLPGVYQLVPQGARLLRVTLTATDTMDLDLVLDGGSISGRLDVESPDAMDGGFSLTLSRRGEDALGATSLRANVGRVGSFVFKYLPPGTYDLHARGSWAIAVLEGITISEGEQRDDVLLELEEGGVVLLRIDAAEASGDLLSFSLIDAQNIAIAPNVTYDDSGRWRLKQLPTGTFRVIAGNRSLGTAWIDGVSVRANEVSTASLAFSARRGRARITASQGAAPLAGARIRIQDAGGRRVIDLSGTSERTDANGEAMTGLLPAGTYSVVLLDAGGESTRVPMTIREDGSTVDVRIEAQ